MSGEWVSFEWLKGVAYCKDAKIRALVSKSKDHDVFRCDNICPLGRRRTRILVEAYETTNPNRSPEVPFRVASCEDLDKKI